LSRRGLRLVRLWERADYDVILSGAKDFSIQTFKQLQGAFLGVASSG